MKTLGDKIRYHRNLKGWSQEVISDKLEISLPAYSKIERNITDVSFSRLNQIAKIFEISLVDFLSNNSLEKTDIINYTKIISDKDQEINRLQRKIIELLEKLNYNNSN